MVGSFAEAIDLANTTSFGLAATVYSSTPENLRHCREINAALVWINEWQHGGVNMVYEPWGVRHPWSFDAKLRGVGIGMTRRLSGRSGCGSSDSSEGRRQGGC
ncbi:aldehyde dehydrogenase family protein [Nonomuraea rubra]|uniref:aldehyde dehydrogenase family protein n=1 Tax=Nonomuraea rubra TaxID=46180 RepID=UPI003326B9F9